MALLKSNNESKALSLHVNMDSSVDLAAIVRQFGGKFTINLTKRIPTIITHTHNRIIPKLGFILLLHKVFSVFSI